MLEAEILLEKCLSNLCVSLMFIGENVIWQM